MRARRITVEPRDGRLCVFMPPVAELEDYLDLLAAVEDTSAELDLPIHLEGYEPPRDPRLGVIKVTPDPGVIEVNVQPAASWDEMRAITEGLYEDAHYTRLVTEKFMLDGRHTGTGGGNHVVLGGARAADSPFLQAARPAAQPDHLLAAPSGALVPLLGHVHRADEPSAARRRGAARFAARARARVQAGGSGAASPRRPGSWTACSAICLIDVTRQHASRRDLHRQAVFAGRAHRAGSASSSSAPSRCRRIRA